MRSESRKNAVKTPTWSRLTVAAQQVEHAIKRCAEIACFSTIPLRRAKQPLPRPRLRDRPRFKPINQRIVSRCIQIDWPRADSPRLRRSDSARYAAAVEEAVFGGVSRTVTTSGPRAIGSRPIYLNAARTDALVDWLESRAVSKAGHDEAEVASPDDEMESTGDFCAAFDRVFDLLGGDG